MKLIDNSMQFPDFDVDLNNGCYLISDNDSLSTIKDIIIQKFNEGVLYSSESVEKCEELYSWCVNKIELDKNDIEILYNDILTYEKLRDLSNKKIIICLNTILLNKIYYLFKYSFNKKYYDNSIKKRLVYETYDIDKNSPIICPRQWILVDGIIYHDVIPQIRILDELKNLRSIDLKILIFSNNISINCYKTNTAFRIERIENILYPARYKNLFTDLDNENFYSRSYHLNNRSNQEKLMDLLIRINYFKIDIHREVPFINDSSYYLVDYYIPKCNLVIELDSDLHDKNKDETRDKYLHNLGIKVVRFKNFTACDEELDEIKNIIKFNISVPIELRFNNIKKYKNDSIVSKSSRKITYFKSENILIKSILEKYGSRFIFNEGNINISYNDNLDVNNIKEGFIRLI